MNYNLCNASTSECGQFDNLSSLETNWHRFFLRLSSYWWISCINSRIYILWQCYEDMQRSPLKSAYMTRKSRRQVPCNPLLCFSLFDVVGADFSLVFMTVPRIQTCTGLNWRGKSLRLKSRGVNCLWDKSLKFTDGLPPPFYHHMQTNNYSRNKTEKTINKTQTQKVSNFYSVIVLLSVNSRKYLFPYTRFLSHKLTW